MSSCVDCKDTIVNRTPSIIGETKCNTECLPQVTCEDYTPSSCVYYSGENLLCSNINFGDTITEVFKQIDGKLGTRVSALDTCCGYLADKVVSDTITITQPIVNGCQKLKLEVQTSGGCQSLTWVDIQVRDQFITNEDDLILSQSGDKEPINLGKRQKLQYAIETCGNNVKKIWWRGLIEVPADTNLTGYPIVLDLPFNITPTRVRVVPLLLLDAYCGDTGGFPSLMFVPGATSLLPGYLRANFVSPSTCPYYFSLDGFSYEIN